MFSLLHSIVTTIILYKCFNEGYRLIEKYYLLLAILHYIFCEDLLDLKITYYCSLCCVLSNRERAQKANLELLKRSCDSFHTNQSQIYILHQNVLLCVAYFAKGKKILHIIAKMKGAISSRRV